MPVAAPSMLSSSFLGSCYSPLVPSPLLERRFVRHLSCRGGARCGLRELPKWSTHPGGCLPSLGHGREFRPSLDLVQFKGRAREVTAQAGISFLLPALGVGVFAWIMAKVLESKALEIIGGGSALNASLLPKLTELEKPYKPYPLLSNRHVETIFATYFRSLPKLTYRRECLTMVDGGTVALDWPQPEVQDPKAVLILLPGLTGGSDDSYVQHFAQRARSKGWAVVVFNSRGCAEAPVTTPQIQSALFTDDMGQVVKHIASLFPSLRVYATGWSVGANILVRYLGQEGESCPLSGAVSLCNVFDLEISSEDFHKGFCRVYNLALAKGLLEMYTKNAHLFKNGGKDFNFPLIENAKTIREFDDGLTRVVFGHKSVDEYYFKASSCRSIKDVRVPLLCVQALTDPIAPERAIPRADCEANPNCLLVITPYGGHLGWVAGPEAPFGCPWTDPLAMQYLEALEEAATDSPGFTKAQEDDGGVELASVSTRKSTERPGLME
ncbi:hypothetical protein KC19_2G175400 [Ceratodon purpureus]|uniref:AB hydrolase-1 domain-containing protein n=1 Tax=Ceratodon purpureus TaxID=3225 RepID=A0A8T0IXF3_CERPU|nr:hypothetical protein KC19_2G175400 [Ceratodon purpureus]